VEDEVHGALVPPGDPNALGTAIQRAIDHPELVDRIGNQNRDLISNFYRQIHYGNNMLAFYSAILPA
jgi:glycosyltransferase involved in cell wall biosynthesis